MSTSLPDNKILFIVNAVFGGRNTPGFRPYQLVRFGLLAPYVIARASAVPYSAIHFPLPGRSIIPRGLNFIRIKFLPRLPSREIERTLFDWLSLRASRRLAWRPRAVHLADALPRTAAFWHAQGVPLVFDLQMAHPRCYQALIARGAVAATALGPLDDRDTDRCIDLAERLVCPSQFVRESLPTSAHPRAVVIPFGADPIVSAKETVALGNANKPLCVLFAGNVNLRKGIPFLLAAWQQLPPDVHNRAELVLCGRLFREMQELLAAAPANVRCVGFQADMEKRYAAADVFVLPSLMEGSAKAVYEAMAHGLPVLVTTHSGSVVRHGVDGLVVEPADVAALTTALTTLLRNADLRQRLGEAARVRARHFSWETYAQGVAALYRDYRDYQGTTCGRLADTYREHQAPRSWRWHVHQALQQTIIRVKATGRVIGGGEAAWLRFPFYHHVFADERRGFIRHLDAMRAMGEFISLDQALELMASGQPFDGRYFCLGFDDGLRNVLTNAAPILVERDIPAAVFVVSDLVGENLGDWGEKHERFYGTNRMPAAFLTWEDCRALVAQGFTVGSHSVNHRRFITLADDVARYELAESKRKIEQELGQACHHFCCPWGKPGRDFVTERDPVIAQEIGYRSFLTTRWGAVGVGDSPFAIRRVGLVAKHGLAQLRYFLSL